MTGPHYISLEQIAALGWVSGVRMREREREREREKEAEGNVKTGQHQKHLTGRKNVHTIGRASQCTEQVSKTNFKEHLEEHINTKHKGVIFICTECQAEFSHRRGLTTHIKFRHVERDKMTDTQIKS